MSETHHLLHRFRTLELRSQINQHIAAGVLEDETRDHPLRPGALPGDPASLRGIPVTGVPRGLGGAIRGTRPDQHTWDVGKEVTA